MLKQYKIFRALKGIAFALYGAIIAGILFLLIFVDKKINYVCKNVVTVPNFLLLIVGIVIIYILINVFKSKNRYRLNVNKVIIICSVFLLFIQLFIIYNIYFEPGWDAGYINAAAGTLASGSGEDIGITYFQRYPNNKFLLFILIICDKISLGLSVNINFVTLILGALMVNASVLLVGIILYKITNNRLITFLGYSIAVILYGVSPWISISYSDTFCILFPILTLYIYLCMKSSKLPLLIRVFAVLFIPCLGYLIKPQSIIILIAIVIGEVLNLADYKITLKKIVSIVLATVITAIIIQSLYFLAQNYIGIDENDDIEFGLTHFAMMGLNNETNGVYDDNDVNFTKSFVGKSLKKQENINEIKRRLSDMGIVGYAKHLAKKTLVNYNDGTFAWGVDGAFYTKILPEKMGKVSSLLRNIYYNDGIYYKLFSIIVQTIWITILFFNIFAVFLKNKKINRNAELIIILSLMGFTIFTSIFEARARYLFVCVPLFIVCGMLGLYKAGHKHEKVENKS